MIGTIRKHQTWLWALIIAAVIVSFVIYFTPTVYRDRSGGRFRGQWGSIHGRPITRKEYADAYTEAQIRQFLRSGRWPDASDARRAGLDLDRMARERIVLADRMKALGVQISDVTVASWIEDNFGASGQPDAARTMYNAVVKELSRVGLSEVDLARYIRHEIGIGHLVAVAGVGGVLVTPREAEMQYRRQNERLEAEAVVIASSNYLAAVTLDPGKLAQFYTNRQAIYRVPEKVQVQYVRFAFTNFNAQAEAALARRTNLTAELDALYLQAGANRFMDPNGQVMTPDAAKAKIREDMLKAEARLAARRAAASFGTELEKLQPAKAENLATIAAQKEIPLSTSAPFSETEGPRELNVRQTFSRAAFALSPAQPISPPVVGEDAVYLLALQSRFPSEIPSFDSVQDRVTEDFRREEARLLAREAGTNFVATLTNFLAQGKPFAEAAAAANLPHLTLPRFSSASRNLPDWDRRVNFEQTKVLAANLQPGKASDLVTTPDGALVLFLKTREAVTDAEVNTALTNYLAELRTERQFEAFSDWFQHQVEATAIDMPSGDDQGG
jgi:hypothetical protein